MASVKNRVAAGVCALLLTAGAMPAAAASSEQVHRGHPHDVLFGVNTSSDGLLAVGSNGRLWQSRDGSQWQSNSNVGDSRALLAVSERQGNLLAVGQQGGIFHNAGDGWKAVEAPVKERLFAVAQGDFGLAVATGAFGAVLCSQDGGRSWRQSQIDWPALIGQNYQPHVYNAAIDARGRIYIVGEFGMIARSDDAGKSWQSLHSGEASLFGLALSDTGLAYAVGQSGTVLRSKDGGDSWKAITSNSDAILMDVAIRADGKAVATGIRQALSISPTSSQARVLNHDAFLESWYSDIAVLGNAFYAVGEQAKVIKISL